MKKEFILPFLVFTVVCFLVDTFIVILFFRLFPEKTVFVYLAVIFFGLLFGAFCYLPFKYFVEKTIPNERREE